MQGPPCQGPEPRFQRPLREASAVARQAAQGEDPRAEEDQEPRLRRGLHLLRHQLQSVARHHATLRRAQLRQVFQGRHHRRGLLRAQHRRYHSGGEPADGTLQGDTAEEFEGKFRISNFKLNYQILFNMINTGYEQKR